MKESEINRIVNLSFSRYFSHKISDPMGGHGIQNPFDGFSVIPNRPVYWESKLLKGYQAFSFKRIEEHQIANLKLIKELLPTAECLIILAVYEPRRFLDFFFFDIQTLLTKMENSLSYKKVELLEMKEKGHLLSLSPGVKIFDPLEALTKKV